MKKSNKATGLIGALPVDWDVMCGGGDIMLLITQPSCGRFCTLAEHASSGSDPLALLR
jgi:hypothetical protein